MRPDDRSGYARVAIIRLIEIVSREQGAPLGHASFVAVTARHIAFRRAQGCSMRDVHRDFLMMRLAVHESLEAWPLDGPLSPSRIDEVYALCLHALAIGERGS